MADTNPTSLATTPDDRKALRSFYAGTGLYTVRQDVRVLLDDIDVLVEAVQWICQQIEQVPAHHRTALEEVLFERAVALSPTPAQPEEGR